MYLFYKYLSVLIYPLLVILLKKRVRIGKEDSSRYIEKLGKYTIKRPFGKLIWFHAASIGEFNAILPIIIEIYEKYPHSKILVTTVTVTAAKIAEKNLPKNAIHQFAPLDSYLVVRRFLLYWQPDLTIWTESEFWPNLLIEAKKQSPILLINARFSEKSFSRWKFFPSFAKQILSCFSLILTQNIETKNFIEYFSINNVTYSGNLKFIAANFNYDKDQLNILKNQLLDRVIVMAASTHPGEEEIFTNIHANLKLKYPKLFTIIAPRHPNRVDEVISVLEKYNLSYVVRSKNSPITKETDVLLVDTIGEFGLFYRLSNIVGMGGSWCKISHNIIEPANLGNIVILGPNFENSKEITDIFLKNNAVILAKTSQEIQSTIEEFTVNSHNFSQIKKNAQSTIQEMDKVKEKTLTFIKPFLELPINN